MFVVTRERKACNKVLDEMFCRSADVDCSSRACFRPRPGGVKVTVRDQPPAEVQKSRGLSDDPRGRCGRSPPSDGRVARRLGSEGLPKGYRASLPARAVRPSSRDRAVKRATKGSHIPLIRIARSVPDQFRWIRGESSWGHYAEWLSVKKD